MVQIDLSPLVLFDGVCNYCNYFVNFAIKRDKKKKLMFTLLQGEAAKHLLPQYYFNIASFSSVISMIKPACRQANDVSWLSEKLEQDEDVQKVFHNMG